MVYTLQRVRFERGLVLMVLMIAGLSVFASGCKKKDAKTPLPPGKCRTDKDCPTEKPHCVEGTCRECKEDAHCPEGHSCVDGACLLKCTSDDDCGPGRICQDGVCRRVSCTSDDDCGPGRVCRDGVCEGLGKDACREDDDCGDEEVCRAGRCVPAPMPTEGPEDCTLNTIYFDFDRATLQKGATGSLQENAECLKKHPNRTIQIEGHCDPRGTEEYNLALSNERAQTVKRYLERLGIDPQRLHVVPKGELEATGTDEETWAKDRKALFIWY